ncbi:hypothetical protein RF11_01981 [Thelohanellus kitauei]|uniref:Uncharacterized protein n=1 Tax=Thelohanellus kitauei TaxID=669202 RepID=A0A0C2MUZ1_THEKT|nr:hypothetical protein RF11_01981 [Thelohanellus kitauei]
MKALEKGDTVSVKYAKTKQLALSERGIMIDLLIISYGDARNGVTGNLFPLIQYVIAADLPKDDEISQAIIDCVDNIQTVIVLFSKEKVVSDKSGIILMHFTIRFKNLKSFYDI